MIIDFKDLFSKETLQTLMNAAASIKGDTVDTLDEAVRILEGDQTADGMTLTSGQEDLAGMQSMTESMVTYFLDGLDLSQITPDDARGIFAQISAQAQPGTPQATIKKEFTNKAYRTLQCEFMNKLRKSN